MTEDEEMEDEEMEDEHEQRRLELERKERDGTFEKELQELLKRKPEVKKFFANDDERDAWLRADGIREVEWRIGYCLERGWPHEAEKWRLEAARMKAEGGAFN